MVHNKRSNEIDLSALKFIFKKSFGLLLLLSVYLFSILWVYYIKPNSLESNKKDGKVLHIAHSISDKKFNRAMNYVASEYEKRNPDVKIVIQSIPKKAYKQWISTQCIGGTAPDIVQGPDSIWDQTWHSLATRYMIPLTKYVNESNPYNAGTKLEGLSWRNTYLDDMESGYWAHLTEFFSIPLTVETTRIFYNKDLFSKIFGNDSPPENFEEWMNKCRLIKEYASKSNAVLFPMACSKEHVSSKFTFLHRYYYSLNDGVSDKYDTSFWGGGSGATTIYGLYTNTFTFMEPGIEAAFDITARISGVCQPGYISNDQSQARFLFTQGKAAMIVGTVRDVSVYKSTIDFNLGVFDFPLPSKQHPQYGRYVVGESSEVGSPSLHFCVSQLSKNPSVAIDFMKFFTSLEINEKFNEIVYWYPIIRQSNPIQFLEAFKPHFQGAGRRAPSYLIAPRLKLWFVQNYPLFLTGKVKYEEFVNGLERKWLEVGIRDFEDWDKNFHKLKIQAERNIAKSQAKRLFSEAGEVKTGMIVGNRTDYELAMEVLQLLEHGISERNYIWHHIKQGDYQFP